MLKKLAIASAIFLGTLGGAQAVVLDSTTGDTIAPGSEARSDNDLFLLSFDMQILGYNHPASSPRPVLELGLSGSFDSGYPLLISSIRLSPTDIWHSGVFGEVAGTDIDLGFDSHHIDVGIDYITETINVFVDGILALTDNSSGMGMHTRANGTKVSWELSAYGNFGSEIQVDIDNLSFVSGTNEPDTGTPSTDVPEPAMAGLLGLSLVGIGFARRRRRVNQ